VKFAFPKDVTGVVGMVIADEAELLAEMAGAIGTDETLSDEPDGEVSAKVLVEMLDGVLEVSDDAAKRPLADGLAVAVGVTTPTGELGELKGSEKLVDAVAVDDVVLNEPDPAVLIAYS
jgi:hypothetical protein